MKINQKLNGGIVKAIKPFSAHPGDTHLYVVLIERDQIVEPWVTWIYDSKNKSCFSGNYFESAKFALHDFNRRQYSRRLDSNRLMSLPFEIRRNETTQVNLIGRKLKTKHITWHVYKDGKWLRRFNKRKQAKEYVKKNEIKV